MLFGASPELIGWLTPIWILGLGVGLGLVLLLALWGICFGLSRVPVIGTIAETPELRNRVSLSIGAVAQPDLGSQMTESLLLSGGFRGQGVQITPSNVSVSVSVQATWVFVPG